MGASVIIYYSWQIGGGWSLGHHLHGYYQNKQPPFVLHLSLPFPLTASPALMTPEEVARNDTCPELPEITNGWKSTSHPELVQGTVVTYQCYPGYQVVGAELLMCQWDLTWSGDLPSCERGE